jgi:hypothetical protein
MKSQDISKLSFDTHFQEYKEKIPGLFERNGKQPYRLYSYFSTQLPEKSTVINTRTQEGCNSLAFSYNPKVHIHSFDISCKIKDNKILDTKNISFHYTDILQKETREYYKDKIFDSSVILLDILSEDGKPEYDFIIFLLEYGYQGIILCNEIWEIKEKRDNFWLKIEDQYKWDVTEIGKESGTGILFFGTENVRLERFPFILEKESRENWTLVTAYFNLTKCPDASTEIIARDANYYFHHAVFTLTLPYNLVIYCDKESLPLIQQYRPKYLEHKTKYMIMEFDYFMVNGKSFKELRDKIN